MRQGEDNKPSFNDTVSDRRLIATFGEARKSQTVAVLEGLHATKHALRFDADIVIAVTDDRARVLRLAAQLAPDMVEWLRCELRVVQRSVFRRLAGKPPATRLLAIATRPAVNVAALIARHSAPVVLLEEPTNLGNVGAVVRVAAALGIGGVLTTGPKDPWDPIAIRGSAGLHYALPVGHWGRAWNDIPRLIAVDPEGEPVRPESIPDDCVLVFGTEREGLSKAARQAATKIIGLPMKSGVSSLNLATSVAMVLFAWSLKQR